MRPWQYTKNLLVFAALIFAQRLGDPDAVILSVIAFVLFCMVSSAVYLINDVRDCEEDRRIRRSAIGRSPAGPSSRFSDAPRRSLLALGAAVGRLLRGEPSRWAR
jgi:decaprenyl-phosphate phosphoribosyltransferase